MLTDGMRLGIQQHDVIGAEFLEELGFPAAVTDLVRYHVEAKRYLVTIDENYYSKLSEASKQTLIHQGGFMTDPEVAAFKNIPSCNDIIQMRMWDERGKDTDVETKPLSYYKTMCRDYLMKLSKHPPTP
ncbi:PREDICTED: uncharacterized protein LOC106810197 [Priapulus caudatus]|uniref:Uncharacterized protein LOC106810197 n=1 Tax=Priapulus caudatus TaxID=37621 RepID=A0ABM1E9U3_PRICU|nr:PREDICTED: uncharacterized protein LOC106810197 [Priapulus caudatus]XP_014668964.1 PREDICTED: uncharacterized protein LOC106810197 [Priapulus caudatus]